jgi:hypothetical protein
MSNNIIFVLMYHRHKLLKVMRFKLEYKELIMKCVCPSRVSACGKTITCMTPRTGMKGSYVCCADSGVRVGGRCVASDWLSAVWAVNAPSQSRAAQLDSSLTRHNEALATDPPSMFHRVFLRLAPLCGEYMQKRWTVCNLFHTASALSHSPHCWKHGQQILSFCFYFKTKIYFLSSVKLCVLSLSFFCPSTLPVTDSLNYDYRIVVLCIGFDAPVN